MGYTRVAGWSSSYTPRARVARSASFTAFGEFPAIEVTPPLTDPATVTTDASWRDAMLKEQVATRQWQERWVKKDEQQRWIQIAATLAIPLTAAIWKAILGRRGRVSGID